jgi:hypothetical protein
MPGSDLIDDFRCPFVALPVDNTGFS